MPSPLFALSSLCLLLPGLGAQTFQFAFQPLSVQVLLGKMAIGDFNGDGRPDLAHVGMLQSWVLTGGYAGIFASPRQLPTPFIGQSVQVVDTNGDGRLDILRCDNNACTRIESTATGFAVTANLGPGRTTACADFDEDGHADVVVAINMGVLALARGNGQGGFLPAGAFATLPLLGWTSLVCGDLDRDGHWDFVAAGLSQVKWFRGNGAGQFTMQSMPVAQATSLCLADVESDGDLDVVAGGSASIPNAVVVLNNGLGQFLSPQAIAGMNTSENVAADFDGDGILDVVGINTSAMLLARGLGGGQFATPILFTGFTLSGLVAGDIDGDGRIEAVTVSGTTALMVMGLVPPAPQGLAAFGTGTPTCSGTIGIRGTVEPLLGATDFRVQCTNVPETSVGLLAFGTAVPGGWQPGGLGLQLHIGAASPLDTMFSDVGGTASVRLSLPSNPIYAGLTVHLQSFWIGNASRGNTCSPAAFELASSRALSVTLQ